MRQAEVISYKEAATIGGLFHFESIQSRDVRPFANP